MQQAGWMRRLDDRADRLLKRRFGFGILDAPQPSLRRQVFLTLVVTGPVVAMLAVAYVGSGQSDKVPTLLGPVLGVTLGMLLGRVIRDTRRRR